MSKLGDAFLAQQTDICATIRCVISQKFIGIRLHLYNGFISQHFGDLAGFRLGIKVSNKRFFIAGKGPNHVAPIRSCSGTTDVSCLGLIWIEIRDVATKFDGGL